MRREQCRNSPAVTGIRVLGFKTCESRALKFRALGLLERFKDVQFRIWGFKLWVLGRRAYRVRRSVSVLATTLRYSETLGPKP